jgi:hypothetical protein
MKTNNYAYYNIGTGLIENVIYIEETVAPTLVWPEGYAIVGIPDGLSGEWSAAGIGWSYISSQFVEPPKPDSVTTQPTVTGADTL